jgi:hypothetical protein
VYFLVEKTMYTVWTSQYIRPKLNSKINKLKVGEGNKTGFEAKVAIALREHNRRNLKPLKSL